MSASRPSIGDVSSPSSAPVLNLTSVLLFLGSGIALIGSNGILDRNYKVFWLAAALTSYLAALFSLVFARTQGFGLGNFRLGSWFLGYAVAAYGLASLTLVGPLDISLGVIDKSSYPAAFAVTAIGATAWSLGYAAVPRKALPGLFAAGKGLIMKGLSESVRGPSVLLALFIVAIGADAFEIVVDGRFGYLGDSTNVTAATVQWYSQLLYILSNLKYVALFGAATRVYVEHKDKAVPLLLPLASITLVLGLMTGMKESFVTCLVSIGVPYFIGKGKLRLLPIILTIVVFVVIVAPAVSALRGDVRGERGSLDVTAALGAASDRIFSADTYLDSEEYSSVESVSSRIRLVDNVALIVQKTPNQVPYRSLNELLVAPVSALVPRVVWPDKPVQISGYEFYRDYYGGLAKSSSAITLPGSFYLYGGITVVFVGMLLSGLLLRRLDDALDARHSLAGALLVTISFTVIVKQEMDVSTFLATVPVLAVTWIIGCRILFMRSEQGGLLFPEHRLSGPTAISHMRSETRSTRYADRGSMRQLRNGRSR